MKKKAILFFFSVLFSISYGQQNSSFSQWYQHSQALNVAYIGSKYCLEVQGSIRGQWIGIDGAPLTSFFTIGAPLSSKRRKFLSARHGIGANVQAEVIGPFKKLYAHVSYAGHFNFTQSERISFGLGFGAEQWVFDKTKAEPLKQDPTINGSNAEIKPSARLGILYKSEKFSVGFAANELIKNKFRFIGSSSTSQTHFSLHGNYNFLVKQGMYFIPTALIQYTKNAPISVQLNANMDLNSTFQFGVGFRNNDAIIFNVGAQINPYLKFSYSYDLIINKYRTGSFHSHELTLRFSPCKKSAADLRVPPLFE